MPRACGRVTMAEIWFRWRCQGQPAQGTTWDAKFGFFEYGGVVINERGQVAFRATLDSPTATGPGLWVADGEGSVIPIAVRVWLLPEPTPFSVAPKRQF